MKVLKRTYRWYAIYTRSRSEKKVYKELLEKGVETYLPLKKELRVWSDRKKWVERPLFSSYVFVRVSEREYYEALSPTWAVRYVCFGGKAIPIPDSQIESLKLFLEDTKRDVELTSKSLKKGDHLEVTIGPLKGVRGELLQLRGQHRIVIRFISLGCCVHADISLDEVKRLKMPIETMYGDN
ncbi:UpxY family transcription antiterminator [Ancylomarina sp.]|uniref:UpxY family transcription antiterminator n=1 Tax=Ancylomarina sp. TaxID=1970196 RepID=UPI003568A331